MACKIIQDKNTGEEFLIPYCYPVSHWWGLEGMTDREIIKQYCVCDRGTKEKYEVKTRDQVFMIIKKLEDKIRKHKYDLAKMESELDCIKSEVFMLNTIEVE